MTTLIPASVDVRAHPHPNSTVTMPASQQSTSYDASAHPTPFLMAGFNPQSRLRKSAAPQSSPSIINNTGEQLLVTVTKPAPGKLQQTQLAPVSFVFTPPSVDIPSSANAPDPVQTRPRSRSSHEATSPRAQPVLSPRNRRPVAVQTNAALPPRAPKAASPLHVDDKFMDFFSTSASIAATQPSSAVSTATSTPVTISRSVKVVESESEEEEEEEEDEAESESETERERKERKAARKAARKAEKAAKKAKKHAKHKKEKVTREKKDIQQLAPAERDRLSTSARWLAQSNFYWVRQEADLSTSTGLGFTKHQVTWRFVLDHRLHELELFHSRFSGKRRIRLDSVELVNEKVLFDGGSSHEIFIGERMLEVVIFIESKPITFGYELLIEGLPFQRAKDNWVMHTKQSLVGYEDQLGKEGGRHAAEEALLEHEEMQGNSHIKRKGSRSNNYDAY